jgi:gas vesicle protein
MAEDSKVQQLGWFLAGLGVGALVGILYAPKSGRETRETLASGAREGIEYARVRSQQVAEKVGTLVDKGKEHAGEFADRGRAQWEEFVERGKNLVNDQTTRVTAAVDAGREAYRNTVAPVDPANL